MQGKEENIEVIEDVCRDYYYDYYYYYYYYYYIVQLHPLLNIICNIEDKDILVASSYIVS